MALTPTILGLISTLLCIMAIWAVQFAGSKLEIWSLGAAAGMNFAALFLVLLSWAFKQQRTPHDPGQPLPKPKRSNFVPPEDDTVHIAVPNGADIATAVAGFAAEAGLEAYQSATAGFLLRDGSRKRVYRARIQTAL